MSQIHTNKVRHIPPPPGFLRHLMPTFNATSTVELPERRHWHTGDTDMHESDSDESEREHPDDTDLDESVSVKAKKNVQK